MRAVEVDHCLHAPPPAQTVELVTAAVAEGRYEQAATLARQLWAADPGGRAVALRWRSSLTALRLAARTAEAELRAAPVVRLQTIPLEQPPLQGSGGLRLRLVSSTLG